MTQTPNPPAGWYPQGGQERWWDGTAWSDNFRPLGSEQTPPGYASVGYGQPTYPQPSYGQPAYGQPQHGPSGGPQAQPSHLARNLLIAFAVVFVVLVGGCVALVAVVSTQVEDVVNDDSLGGPNNPMTITEGQAFEVDGFEYAGGWGIADTPVTGLLEVENLKVTNHRSRADRLWVRIDLLSGNEVVASATCVGGQGDKIPREVTVTVDCSSGDELPPAYDRVTIKDVV